MSARQVLAAAHARMTPAEIAEHALMLADHIEEQAAAVAALLRLGAAQRGYIGQVERYAIGTMTGVRRVQSLITRRQRAAAHRLLAQIAAQGPLTPIDDPFDFAAAAKAAELPADLFDPTLSEEA